MATNVLFMFEYHIILNYFVLKCVVFEIFGLKTHKIVVSHQSYPLKEVVQAGVGTRFENFCPFLRTANFKNFCPVLTSSVLGQVSVMSCPEGIREYTFLLDKIFGRFFRLSFAMKNA